MPSDKVLCALSRHRVLCHKEKCFELLCSLIIHFLPVNCIPPALPVSRCGNAAIYCDEYIFLQWDKTSYDAEILRDIVHVRCPCTKLTFPDYKYLPGSPDTACGTAPAPQIRYCRNVWHVFLPS